MEEKRHTSLHYEKELQEIKDGLIYQGALTEKAIQLAMRSLSERNSEIAKRVIKDDEEIDKLDTDLEDRCIKILALRQPTAIDLRFITTAIKITGHLERIGDMAVNIAEKALQLNDDLHDGGFQIDSSRPADHAGIQKYGAHCRSRQRHCGYGNVYGDR